jgi:hypothetical protein
MPSLEDILKDTMLMVAAKGKGVVDPLVENGIPPFASPSPKKPSELRAEFITVDARAAEGLEKHIAAQIESNPIWHYEPPVFTTAPDDAGKPQPVVRVSAVKCLISDMDYAMPITVCKRIEWGSVSILRTDQGQEIPLPLTEEFQLKEWTAFLPEGHIKAGAAWLWPLEARTDVSFQLVFGYAITGSNKPRKLSKGERLCPTLMPSTADKKSEKTRVAPGKANVLCTTDLVIVVCVTLVMGKERANFEPGGVLGAGRINPMILAMSSEPLAKLKGSVTMVRPEFRDVCSHHSSEAMTKDLGSAFFTDRNKLPSPPLPYWNIMFDYYDTEPTLGEYVMVQRMAESKRRGGLGKIGSREVYKVAGQGAYDNIHVAPRMIATLNLPKDKADWYKGWGLDQIVMAPFCVHDCFHMHWRWGADHAKQALGWDGFTPYAKAETPQVPPNQEVKVKLLEPTSFRYSAEAAPVEPSRWEVIMHHGSAYALSVRGAPGILKEVITKLPTGPEGSKPDSDDEEWAMFYWYLRYEVVDDVDVRWAWPPAVHTKKYHQRIRFTPVEMKRLAAN